MYIHVPSRAVPLVLRGCSPSPHGGAQVGGGVGLGTGHLRPTAACGDLVTEEVSVCVGADKTRGW